MRLAKVYCSSCALVFACAALAHTEPPNKVATTQVTKIELDGSKLERSVSLKGDIQVSLQWKDGNTISSVKSAAITHTDKFSRGAAVYVTQPEPTFTIVVDDFASDEDRLIVYDMSDKVKPLRVSHSSDSYLHQHFEVGDAKGEGIEIKETEYGGDNAARKRTFLLTKGKGGFSIAKGQWEKDG